MDRSTFSIRRRRLTLVPALLALLVVFVMGAEATRSFADEWETGQLQVELIPGTPISVINDLYGTSTLDSLPPLYLLRCPDGSEADYVYQIRQNPNVVEAEYSWDNETPEGTRQMMVAAVGGTITDYLDQHLTTRIHLAEIQSHTMGDGVLVAVIDTGVLPDHPAFDGAIEPNGWDFVDNDADPLDEANGVDDDLDGLTDDGAGHGTMVAGIVHLVAPHARILPVRVLNDEGRGTTFNVAKGIRYAFEHGAQVINLSLGLTQECMVIRHEVRAAYDQSVAMVGAAGNGGSDYPVYYPASDPHVVSVAALDSVDVRTSFTSYGSTVDVAAPGDGVLAPFYDGEYAIGAGTSFSAPFVSGQCALVLSLKPDAGVQTVYATIGLGVVGIYQIPENGPYEGKLGSGRFDGMATWVTSPKTADVDGTGLASGRLELFPNPSRVGQGVSFRLDNAGAPSRMVVVDATGRRVRTIEPGPTGLARWNGRDASGRAVPPGVYFVHADGGALQGRIVLDR
jgi:subtilisin family serine protease